MPLEFEFVSTLLPLEFKISTLDPVEHVTVTGRGCVISIFSPLLPLLDIVEPQ